MSRCKITSRCKSSHVTTACLLAMLLPLFASADLAADDAFLVKEGEPQAEIVIAETPPRSTHLAARELQVYIEKISGATLPIVTAPNPDVPVKVYVGRSPRTDRLGITADDLPYGAFRIVSGKNWLTLIGQDSDFTPIEPWPFNNKDIAGGKMQKAWDEITGEHWGYPHHQLWKHYSGRNQLFGTPEELKVNADGSVNVWTYDERGSFNAVCGYLRDLGVRWYMPGEVGEVLPRMKTIPLSAVDKAVHPDFPLRCLNFRSSASGRDVSMWAFHLGVRQVYGRQAAHGLHLMTNNEYTRTHHPDWFAVYGGKRQTQDGLRQNHLCYSNEELVHEAVRFAEAQFDHYKMDVVSIMPPDGYTSLCQCELCQRKESPELGPRGIASNYVWSFVNRVAKELKERRPDKKISCCAYGIYTAPPSNIEKLEPNLQVIIVGGRRPTQADREALRRLRAEWATKTDNLLEIYENYPFTNRGFYLPAYVTHVMGESINETKGMSRGEDVWFSIDFSEKATGFNHFLAYFTARMYWGGKQQDVSAMFDEYVEQFYGPAAADMHAFFDYCEEHWREMETDVVPAQRALELIEMAKKTAGTDNVYATRVGLIDRYLDGLRNKAAQLAQQRGPVPRLRIPDDHLATPIVVDGRLDDQAWVDCMSAATGRLKELQTGREPIFGTRIKTRWIGGNLYFAIHCDERPGEKLNIATTKNGDQALWYGDVVEILLETNSHSYYQIAFNPAAALVDFDRGTDRKNWSSWASQAEVATQIADDHWTAEVRIPVTDDENDPLHQVIGRRPTQSLPWHVNICRQRIREQGSEYSAFSPTGTAGFHEKMKFAHFYFGLSHDFDVDPAVTDYLIASRAAELLARERNPAGAIAAFVALTDDAKSTDFQKSDALERAARIARKQKDYQRAAELADRIPIDAVAKTVRMENLAAQRQWSAIVEQYGAEDLRGWPFWQIGAGAFARAKAYVVTKAGEKAEADLKLALEFTADKRTRNSILAYLGSNREENLHDDQAALAAYRQNYEGNAHVGGAEEMRSVQRASLILAQQGRFEEALQTLARIDVEQRQGYWRHTTLLTLGEIQRSAGHTEEAIDAYRRVVDDETAISAHRKTAEEALAKLRQ